ncbi:FAS-associated death domain protein [Bos indicus]|uniref:FAS-associated death domain protein n=3 Tax=Bos TaxID=9903 RepID=FADD_BOVIN|nr:FAS-associated death domain protein [Bos taurus]XP_061263283.1 FAS-associated death domain protein [Bos javanicus]Q645M6.1 RecName: Full=FAS-associated death domain protein; AltName: Full=FAS-associating death domain-containing protein [Bos taurus]AAI20181.1 Fas (TNFRSF6)-associated via death domain [Bos taurus]AAU20801.1 Fas-associated via death domain [Bos taurus]DAA13529.1 TPA: protein FADD [Bos taurus]
MDPFLVLLHSVSAGLSSSDLTQLKFLCQNHISKRKLELAQSGLDLFTVLLQQNELNAEHTALLRELLCSLRRKDLLLRLDDFERGAAGGAAPEDRDLRAAMEIICDNVGKDWRRLARHLGVSDVKIEAIEEKYPRNLAEQVRELLRVWKNSTRENAAVSCLVGALRGCQLNVVADLIEEDQRARALQSGSANPGSFTAWDSGSAAPGAS